MSKFLNKKAFPYIAITLVIAILFCADRILKFIALNSKNAEPFKLLGNFFYFHFATNPNMAFSLPFSGNALNILIIIVIALLLVYIIYLIANKKKLNLEIILLSIILAGALSNVFDRLSYGYVIDYLELKYFTIFNLGDLLISAGAAILIFKNLKK